MEKLKKHIHDDGNSLDYVLVGDYYIPDLQLPEESRPIGMKCYTNVVTGVANKI